MNETDYFKLSLRERLKARRAQAERERAQAHAEITALREDLAQPGLTDQKRQQLMTLEEWAGARAAEHLAEMEAARQAEQFTERLSEDYRDDSEHQTALAEYEEKLRPLEKAKEEAEARARVATHAYSQAEAELMRLNQDLEQPELTLQEREILQNERERIARVSAGHALEMDAAQDAANDIQDQIDNLEEPRAPAWKVSP